MFDTIQGKALIAAQIERDVGIYTEVNLSIYLGPRFGHKGGMNIPIREIRQFKQFIHHIQVV